MPTLTSSINRKLVEACHFLSHAQGDGHVAINNTLNQGMPAVVALEPYMGTISVPVDIDIGSSFKAVCYYLHSEKDFYTSPRYITNVEDIPEGTFLILTQNDHGYSCYFALSHADQMVSLAPHDAVTMTLKATSGTSRRANQRRWALVACRGDTADQALSSAMQIALRLTGGLGKMLKDKSDLPVWLSTLGWNSKLLGDNLCYDSIISAIRNLRSEGFGIGYVIIEEGWQHLAVNSKDRLLRPCLASFDADPKRFPSGLRGLVDALKDLGVNQVGVWHAIMGAKHGLRPDIARDYDLPPDDNGRLFLGYDLGRTFQFYFDYYGYLRQQGITFVKAGNQLGTRAFCRAGMDVTQLHQNLQIAMQGAANIHFNTAPLNSECLGCKNLFYWPTSHISRAADDVDLAHFSGVLRTIRNNLSNAVWLGQMMQPDFDIWRTDAEGHEMLATFHALSGTLLQIGDYSGSIHSALLKKIVLPSGKVLTSDHLLKLCPDSVFVNPLDEKQAYKAYTTKQNMGVIAAFNLCSGRRTVHGTVSATDVEGLKGERFAVYSHRRGFLGVITHEEKISFTLKPRESDIFTFSPLTRGIAVIGSHTFLLAPGPITEIVIEDDSIHIGSIVAAPILLYCEHQILEIKRNNEIVPWEYDYRRHLLCLDTRLHVEEIPSIYSITLE
ncbi:MAG: Sip1-related alpha-galactosidase [Chlamydiales bacterium]|nr:Sip1-related alpha-galactosidase [Chlamydiales bacterium]